jgi:hypothetical protein
VSGHVFGDGGAQAIAKSSNWKELAKLDWFDHELGEEALAKIPLRR